MIFNMRPVVGLLLCAALLPACGDAAADDSVSTTAEEMVATAETVADLADRLSALESDLADETDAREKMLASFDSLEGSVDRSIEKIRSALRELRSDLASGRGDIESALGQIGSLTRDLAVLDQRLDYHLRNHGG
jgi:predicted  nucleic acid-binding Zn-ribbon protein